MTEFDATRELLGDLWPASIARGATAAEGWLQVWNGVAAELLNRLEGGQTERFDSGFLPVSRTMTSVEPAGREAAVTALFGDFTRRAIAAGFDRTRFVDWFGPTELFAVPLGRVRGRVLYFHHAKGRGKMLGSDRIVYFVHFSAIVAAGNRTLGGGQLVEFTPRFESVNGQMMWAGREVMRLSEFNGTQILGPTG